MAFHVHADRPGLDRGGHQFLGFALAAQHRPDPGDQFPGRVGLGHIVVGTDFQAHDFVDFRVLGRQHDHRYRGALAQLPADLGTGLPGEHEVQQDQICPVAVELDDGVEPVIDDLNLEAFFGQQVFQRVAQRLLVFDHQDAGQIGSPSARGRCAFAPPEGWSVAVSVSRAWPGSRAASRASSCRGMRTVKVEPCPGRDHSVTSPP